MVPVIGYSYGFNNIYGEDGNDTMIGGDKK